MDSPSKSNRIQFIKKVRIKYTFRNPPIEFYLVGTQLYIRNKCIFFYYCSEIWLYVFGSFNFVVILTFIRPLNTMHRSFKHNATVNVRATHFKIFFSIFLFWIIAYGKRQGFQKQITFFGHLLVYEFNGNIKILFSMFMCMSSIVNAEKKPNVFVDYQYKSSTLMYNFHQQSFPDFVSVPKL